MLLKQPKLQRWLADHAAAPSRRVAERWIQAGRLKVNGAPAHLGQRVNAGDRIQLDGRLVQAASSSETRVIVYHKPIGEVSTRSDPEQRHTVFQALPPLKSGRWVMVGRLDIQTSGLLLFTNQGDLAHHLMHPSREVVRTYLVRIQGSLTPDVQKKLCSGVNLEDGQAVFDQLQKAPSSSGSNQWYQVSLHQGRNRIIRRMFQAVDVSVNRLMRIGFGPIQLARSLNPGQWQALSQAQLQALRALS